MAARFRRCGADLAACIRHTLAFFSPRDRDRCSTPAALGGRSRNSRSEISRFGGGALNGPRVLGHTAREPSPLRHSARTANIVWRSCVARDGQVNVNPSIQSTQIELDAASWLTWTESHYVTAGDLERAHTVIDSTSPRPKVKLHWSAPSTVTAGGQLVRFHFVLRDGRGGVDWTTRAVCIVP
jgi:hypothetical protein